MNSKTPDTNDTDAQAATAVCDESALIETDAVNGRTTVIQENETPSSGESTEKAKRQMGSRDECAPRHDEDSAAKSAPEDQNAPKDVKAKEESPASENVKRAEKPDTLLSVQEEDADRLSTQAPSGFKSRFRRAFEKRSLRMATIVFGLCLIVLFSFRWYLFERAVPFKVETTDIAVMVADGDSARLVMAKLEENGLDVSPTTMRLAARFADIDLRRIHAGLYKFEAGLSPVGILERIAQGALADQQLRIPDGAPIWEVMKLIRTHEGIKQTIGDKSSAELAALLGLESPSLEGWFAPDTYHFASGTTDIAVMKAAVKLQRDRLQKAWETRADDVQVKTIYEALILASIIEKETGHSADRALISSVFNNRLRIKMPLQTDPTVIYGIGEKFVGNLRRRDLNTTTPYNTYKIQGLPPTPIAMPSPASLEAAMHPAKSTFLYFVSRGDGTSEFTTNLKDHNRAVQKYILKRR